MLNYKTIADLIAAFQSGVQFKADTPDRTGLDVVGISLAPNRRGRFQVTTRNPLGGTSTWIQYRLNGSHELGAQWRLYQVEVPCQTAPVETSFPFASVDALIAAFNAGVKFEVTGAAFPNPTRAVTKIEKTGLDFRVTDEAGPQSTWGCFDIAGRNSSSSAVLRVKQEAKVPSVPAPVEDAPVDTSANPLRVSESGSVTSAPAPAPAPKRAVDFPNWLDELAKGTKFYCPATNEDVTGITVSAKGLQVMLAKVGVTGATPRHSTNYRMNGSHKHVYARSLVVKPEPVAAPAPRVGKSSRAAIFKNRLNGQLFVVREGEVLPPIRGVRDAALVGETTIVE